MSVRVPVNPELIRWARRRSAIDAENLRRRFPKLDAWEDGSSAPTLKQLERLAKATHTPVGYLFLDAPPEEPVPIPDYRTRLDAGVRRPSPGLLDTIFQCQQRQDWYRSFAQADRLGTLPFVGSLQASTPVDEAAWIIRDALGYHPAARGRTFAEAFRLLTEEAEELGILVMTSGIVGSNTHRRLDPDEFRGFALVDPFAPLVFVNGSDTKAAQIFSLAHELAHIWLGETALSNADTGSVPAHEPERWCNEVAAELLVPLDALRRVLRPSGDLTTELDRLATRFKVSTLVILRRLRDVGQVSAGAYHEAYEAELARVLGFLEEQAGPSGGDFYNTQPVRLSRRFVRELISSTREGRTLYTEAFQLLGIKRLATFNTLATRVGVA